MLKSIIIVTISVLNLTSVEDAYHDHLGYTAVDQGELSAAVTKTWNTENMTGSKYLVMQPSSNEKVYLRFVENPTTADHTAMTTHGWNSTELLVKDPDTLAEQLADTPFTLIGPPKDLWPTPNAPRAMQVLGPANEVLYLTNNQNFEFSAFVDRVFISVLSGPSMQELADYYSNALGLKVSDATPFKISVISNMQNMPADTTYPLAIAAISERFLIELDEYPPSTSARPVTNGYLPPGTSMVSFEVEDLDAFNVDWRAAPKTLDGLPYNDRRTAVTVGPAGEWIELIEMN
ncbi:MAG: hypothetical protein QF483_09555 [Gammaproteobacteria bacterium]|jgi:hypothetical protein|nr:hypothetical protein [Gammaproteobacteria bacterium]MDP7154589.1 hypothetical protein [Gammaproteobacteria bacterium]MDP7296674.1 hypothetical protein [Gammaproteobacteria bacterium]MDP7420117.1 hypothetical protein [Gammaproteobacteria bacterium]HJP38344.1 hypothetical protein [Gammaproteobacteria bacterium]